MPASTLFRGEKVYDDSNIHELIGSIHPGEEFPSVLVGGERRLMARVPPPVGKIPSGYCQAYSEALLPLIKESDYDAAIDEQIARQALVSDHVDFPAFDQDGLPTCWAICTAQCYSIYRRCLGLPHRQMSGCSLAVPISGGHSGGYEGDSLEKAVKDGIASVDTWPENNTSRNLDSDAAVVADRMLHRVTIWMDMQSRQQWASALLRTKPGVFAYNRMSHCMTMCDWVRIEAGHYGYRVRNSWRDDWGAKNRHGVGGFAVYAWDPDSGAIILDITQSEK